MPLCRPCGDHFGFRIPDLVDGIKKLKQDAIDEAVRTRKGRAAIRSMQRDLERFAKGFPAHPNATTPIPWCLEDDAKKKSTDRQTTDVWTAKEPRPWADVQKNLTPGGCNMCHVLVGMVEYARLTGNDLDPTSLTSEWVFQEGTLLPSMLRVHAYSSPACRAEDLLDTFWFYCKLEGIRAVDLASHLPLVPMMPEERESRLKFMARAYWECKNKHSECAAAQTERWVPTRLMNISSNTDWLYLEEDPAAFIDYATLSLACGSDFKNPARLTIENYEQYKDRSRGLNYQELPDALKSAVSKLRVLGIHRLWVDDLCIIQDSKDDREREALTTDQIYQNASLNLALCDVLDTRRNRTNVNDVNGNGANGNNANGNNANGNGLNGNNANGNHANGNGANGNNANGNGVNGNNANGNHANGNGANGNNANGNDVNDNDVNDNDANDSDANDSDANGNHANGGFTQNPPPLPHIDDPLPLPQHEQRFQVSHYFMEGMVVYDILPDWARLTRDHSALHKRGCALQERLLSRRQFHFATVPFFECHRGLFTQAYSQGTHISPAFGEYLGSEKNWIPEGPLNADTVLTRWLENIEMYSGKAITNPADKLLAIGGLAKWFSPKLEVGYYAGVWGGSPLARSLLWTPDGKRDAHSLPTYRAPSWSWASVDSAVHMTSKHAQVTQVLVQNPSPSTTPKAGNPFGQVSAGSITLHGHLLEIRDLLARLGQLKSADECRLDRTDQVRRRDVTYFLPVARLTDERGASFQGLFLRELIREMDSETVRCFHRVGMGRISEARVTTENDPPEFILNDDSWAALMLQPYAGSTAGMQTVVII